MTKSIDAITEAVQSNRSFARNILSRPTKALKNRYQRRKVKEFLHMSEFITEGADASLPESA